MKPPRSTHSKALPALPWLAGIVVLPAGLMAADLTPGLARVWGGSANGLTNAPAGLSNVVAVAAGAVHNLALKSDGTVVAWGLNGHGETNVPPDLSNVVAIATSGVFFNAYDHNLALKADGTIVTWGSQTTFPDVFKPAGLSNIMAIATGPGQSLVLSSNGLVTAWGYPPYVTNVPAGLSNVVAIAAGGSHNLALKSDGTVVAWGTNASGQTNVPAGLNDVMAIAAGNQHSLALRSNGVVVAWGNNSYGQTNVPAGLSNVIAIATGASEFGNHNLALKSDGTVVEWGQVFDYSGGFLESPPAGLSNVVSVAAGTSDSLAIAAGLQIKSFGFTGQNPAINFHTFAGRQYTVEFSSDPGLSTWTNLPGGDVQGNGLDASVTDTNAGGLSERFYRLRSN
jgi:alpha-tubulin suppressor-like RCC1 family protein